MSPRHEYFNIEKVDNLADEVLSRSEAERYDRGLIIALRTKTIVAGRLSKFEDLRQYVERGLEVCRRSGDTKYESSFLLIYSTYFKTFLEDYETSYSYLLMAEKAALDNFNFRTLGWVYFTMAENFAEYDIDEMAIEYFDKAAEHFQKIGQSQDFLRARNGVNKVYLKAARLDEVLPLAEANYEYALKVQNPFVRHETTTILARTFRKRKDFDRAFYYAQEAQQIAEKLDLAYYHLITKYELLKTLLTADLHREAAVILQEIKPYQEQVDNPDLNRKILRASVKLSELAGDFETAFYQLKEYSRLQHNFHQNNSRRRVQYMNAQHKLEEIEKDKEIFRLQNVELAQRNEEIRMQNENLESIRYEVEIQNKNMQDSIDYATLIQTSILPTLQFMQKCLPDVFVYFNPRDKVSGDFIWVDTHGAKTVVALADCTGHGVPGAFLSLVGHNLLSQIVPVFDYDSPHHALELLDYRVRKTLRQNATDSHSKDGMDLALVSLDFESSMLQFSGARRPLLLIRDGAVIEFKGDKHSVGGFSTEDKKFELHRIQFKPGDRFFLFSDGFIDQFGGEQHRKYHVESFYQLLLSTSDLTLAQQRDAIINTFDVWKGSHRQLDDVTVLGFTV
jgi:serine phosphatase RsbU (regulator of sigma subunit)